MVLKTRLNSYIQLIKFDKRSLKNRIKWIRKNYMVKKKNNFFFNLNKIFFFNNYYIFYNYTSLRIKKKKNSWRNFSYKHVFRDNYSFGKFRLYKKMWLKCIKNFSKIQNKYIMYIRYFYTYKSLKFKNFTW